jgi:hypothetical protein
LLLQPREPISEKPFSPSAYDLTPAVEAHGDLVVAQPFGGQQNHLGALNMKIR